MILLIAATGLVLLLGLMPGAGAVGSGGNYPYSGAGDWTIDKNDNVVRTETDNINGNLVVKNGGKIIFMNSVINMRLPNNDAQFAIKVEAGGELYIYDSTVTRGLTFHYEFKAEKGSKLEINRSSISEMYGKNGDWLGGIQIYTDNAVIGNSTIYNGQNTGIYIRESSPTILNNNIYGNGYDAPGVAWNWPFKPLIAGIYIFNASKPLIQGNTVRDNEYAMWGYYWGGNGIYSEYSSPRLIGNSVYDNGFYGSSWYYSFGRGVYIAYSYNNNTTIQMTGNSIRQQPYNLEFYRINFTAENNIIDYVSPYYPYPEQLHVKIDRSAGLFANNSVSERYDQYYTYGWNLMVITSSTLRVVNNTFTNTQNSYYMWGNQVTDLIVSGSTIELENNRFTHSESHSSYGYGYMVGWSISSSTVYAGNNTVTLSPNLYTYPWTGAYLYVYGVQSSANTMTMVGNRFTITLGSVTVNPYVTGFTDSLSTLNGKNNTFSITFSTGTTLPASIYGMRLTSTTLDLAGTTVSVTAQSANSQDLYGITGDGIGGKMDTVKVSLSYTGGTGTTVRGIWLNRLSSPTIASPSVTFTSNYGGSFTAMKIERASNPVISGASLKVVTTNPGRITTRTGIDMAWYSAPEIRDTTIAVSDGFLTAVRASSYSSPTFRSVSLGALATGLSATWYSTPVLYNSAITDTPRAVFAEDSSTITAYDSALNNRSAPSPLIETYITNGSVVNIVNTTYDDNFLFGSADARVNVGWYLRVITKWQNGAPVAGGVLTLTDTLGAVAVNTTTDAGGATLWLTVFQFTQNLSGKTQFTPHALALQKNRFTGKSQVTVDKSQEVTVQFTDPAPPKVTINYPSDKHLQNSTTVTVNGIATDDEAGLARMEYSLDGGAPQALTFSPLTGVWSLTLTADERAHKVSVKAYDIADLSGEAGVSFTIDLTPPKVTITSPKSNLTSQRQIFINGTTEAGTVMTIDGFPLAVGADGSFSFPVALLEGRNTFTLTARDPVMNTAVVKVEVSLDSIAPYLTVTSPADRSHTAGSQVKVTGFTEPGASVGVNGPGTASTGSFTITASLKEGANTLVVSAVDAAGNRAEVTRTVFLDTKLALNVASPDDGLVTATARLTVTGDVGGETGVVVEVNGAPVATGPDGFTVNLTLTEGPNTVVVSAMDRAGNSLVVVRVVTLDTVPPLLAVSYPADRALVNTAAITALGLTEPGALVSLHGKDVTVGSDGTFRADLALAEGNNTLTFVATDKAGNRATLVLTVVLDSQPPALAIASPGESARVKDGVVLVTGTTEPGATVTVEGIRAVVDPDGSYSVRVPAGKKGAVTVKATATDRAGNSASVERTFTYAPASVAGVSENYPSLWLLLGLILGLAVAAPIGWYTMKEVGRRLEKRDLYRQDRGNNFPPSGGPGAGGRW